MKKQLVRVIALLASMQYQRKYIVHATISSYVLPEELLEDAIGTLRVTLAQGTLSKCLSEQELDAAHDCLTIFSTTHIQFGNQEIDNENLILHDDSWNTVRFAAQKFLAVLGVDPSKVDEIADGNR